MLSGGAVGANSWSKSNVGKDGGREKVRSQKSSLASWGTTMGSAISCHTSAGGVVVGSVPMPSAGIRLGPGIQADSHDWGVGLGSAWGKDALVGENLNRVAGGSAVMGGSGRDLPPSTTPMRRLRPERERSPAQSILSLAQLNGPVQPGCCGA